MGTRRISIRFGVLVGLLCAGHASPTLAGVDTGTVRTSVLGPVAMLNTAPLDFGGIIPVGGGTVTINAQTGARTSTGVVLAGGTASNARFVATGTANRVVTISLNPVPIVITNGAASMSISQIRVSVNGGGPQPVGPNANLGPLGVIDYAIGGRLTVAANQAAGQYTGVFSLTMDYQELAIAPGAAYLAGMTFDPRSVLYADTLDPGDAQRLTRDALSACDDGELYLQYRTNESFGFDDGRLKVADYGSARGFGLRGVSGEATGFAHSDDVSPAGIARAAATLKLLDPSASGHAQPPRKSNRHLYTDADPLSLVPFADKVALCQRIDAAARARDPRVVQVSVGLSGTWNVVEIVRADGYVATDIRPLVRLNVSIVAQVGDRRESGNFGMGGRYLYDRLFDESVWNRAIDEALAQALVNLDSVAAPAGETTVLLGPGWPGILLHEAIGHGLEGDFNRKGTSAFSGRIGERVAAPGVTVVDDGSIPDRRGSLSIDDEGTPTSETVLIEDGILRGYMQDRLNARLMGVPATGNGRRESYAHAPMPRMTNTFMKNGRDDPGELLSRVKKGIFAKSFGGGQVDIVSGKFVFSCTEAYLIENGRIGAPIKGATLIGDGPSVLTKVSGIGNDFALDEGIGVCGKGGQSVPAGVGQPTLLIDGLTVGGTAA